MIGSYPLPLQDGQIFNAYEEWEAKVRPNYMNATTGSGQKVKLWQPAYVEIEVAAAQALGFKDVVARIKNEIGASLLITEDSLAILDRLAAEKPNPNVPDVAWRFILYCPSDKIRDVPTYQDPTSHQQLFLYKIMRLGPAVPRSVLATFISAGDTVPLGTPRANGGVVLTGIVDDFMGVAHARFRSEEKKTRIEHYWKQGVEGFSLVGPGSGVLLGQEFSKSDLNALLADSASESDFYARLDQVIENNSWARSWAKFIEDLILAIDVASTLPENELQSLKDDLNAQLDKLADNGVLIALSSLLGLSVEAILGELRAGIADLGGARSSAGRSSITFDLFSASAQFADRFFNRPLGFAAAHGTAVMDLAAGYDFEEEDEAGAGKRPIVAVELPPLATVETNGARLEFYVLQAVHRILFWADRYGDDINALEQVPLVINLSYGITAGPKNGRGFLESQLAELIEKRHATMPTYLVLPSGNSYRDQLSATATVSRGDHLDIDWRVPGDDQTPSYVEIRLDRLIDFDFTLTLPDSEPKTIHHSDLSAGNVFVVEFKNTAGLYKAAIFLEEDPGRSGEALITVALAPTATVEAPFHRTVPGGHQLRIDNTGARDLNVDIDVQRDDTPIGFPSFGRQGYLDDGKVDELDEVTKNYQAPTLATAPGVTPSVVTRDRTMSAIATSSAIAIPPKPEPKVAVVGGAFPSDNSSGGVAGDRPPTTYTASGAGLEVKPGLSAVSETGRVLQGILAAGPHTGSCAVISGTSVAAPQVTRLLVNYLVILASAPPHTARKVAAVVLNPVPPTAQPDPRLGYGTLPPHPSIARRRYLTP